MPDKARRIRELAHHIWEEEGRPHGRDGEHWEKARQMVEREDAELAKSTRGKKESLAEGRALK